MDYLKRIGEAPAMRNYVHGYSEQETVRLADQARTLAELLHWDTSFAPGSRVLEAGCGTGAQTVFLARSSPEAQLVSVDISANSLAEARVKTEQGGITNVEFRQADLYQLAFEDESFDHAFVCFVLEHLHSPLTALKELQRVLRPSGTITVIEGDHGSFYCYPQSKEASLTVNCLIEVQASLGGNSLIGRQLFPLLKKTNFKTVKVSPRMVYVDSSKPELVDGFSKKTFIAMVEGVKEQALSMNLIDEQTWSKGIADLYRATQDDGTFCYSFFKALGAKTVQS